MEAVQYYTHELNNSTIVPALDGGDIKSDDCMDEAMHIGLKEATAALRGREGGSKRSQEYEVDIMNLHLFALLGRKLTFYGTARCDLKIRCGELRKCLRKKIVRNLTMGDFAMIRRIRDASNGFRLT